ncbi:MAG: thioredoxin-dependent thiol peroxidase [Fibrobacter sp.]|nr:thioredoxin-dependent thiol peroxidase [Fibrobacter sp.]
MNINTKAPDFSLFNAVNNEISLEQYLGKWVIVYFYPKDNTSGCTREAIDFSNLNSKFSSENAVILGISPDSQKSHTNFITKQSLTIELLSDPDHAVAEMYGVWQKKKLYGKEYMGIVRSTFLIDPDGIIREIWNKVSVAQHAETVFNTLCTLKR